MSAYLIVLASCDDSTVIREDLTDGEFAVVERIAAASERASNSGCQPRLVIVPFDHPDFHYERVTLEDREAALAEAD